MATSTISSVESFRLSVLGGGGGAEGEGGEGGDGVREGGEGLRRRRLRGTLPGSHSLSSFAIFDAMFLKPMLVPGNTI